MALDRRTALKALAGAAGAGTTFGCGEGRLLAGGPTGEQSVAPAQPIVRLQQTGTFRSIALAQVPLGGGGYVTGIDVSKDGDLLVCRTDVTNAYLRRRNDRHWTPFFTTASMQPKDYDPLPEENGKADGSGVAAIRIAPSDKNVIYAAFRGYVWKTLDGGRTIRRTALPQLKMLANSGFQRLYNRTIDVHPNDPDTVVVGTWGEGTWYSRDGGGRWVQIKLPASLKSLDDQPGVYLVCFDPAQPQRVYIFVAGLGLYRSEEGVEGEFGLAAGGPTFCSSMVSGPNGFVYLCERTKEGRGGRPWRFSPTSGWTSAHTEREAQVVGVHPNGSGSVVLIDPNGFFMTSQDHGLTFTSNFDGKWSSSGGEAGWKSDLPLMFPAEVVYDPLASQGLMIAEGFGVARVQTRDPPFTIHDWSAGIEALCAVSALCVPGGKTFFGCWDKSFWRVDTLASYSNDYRYPLANGRAHDPSLVAFSSYLDYAPNDPNFLVGIIAPSDRSAPGYTRDGGSNWKAFSAAPEGGWGVGGCIAAGSKDNIIILPSNNGTGVYTLDGGRSWMPVKLDGSNPTDRFANAYYVQRKNLTADKQRSGTFALVYTTMTVRDEHNSPLGGLWVTHDGGRNWVRRFKGLIGTGTYDPTTMYNLGVDPRQYWQCQLDYVPGRRGELVYTPHADARADRFYWSADDGATWKEMHRSIRNVKAFGFGKAAPGQERPALFFWGSVKGDNGLYATFDWFASEPRLITRFPSPMLGQVACIAGDPDRVGRLYVGTICAGYVRVELEV